jgi:hypothetical protein
MSLGLLAAALGLSVLAQLALRGGSQAGGAAAALGALALGALAARLARGPESERPAPAPALPWSALRPPRPEAAAAGAALLALVLALQALDRAYLAQLACWALSVLAWSAAYVPRGAPRLQPVRGETLLVLSLVALGLAARLIGLAHVPGGLYGDEGEFGLRALALLEGTRVPPFSVAFDQHPTFFHWVQAGGMLIAGRDVVGVRFASAVAGGLTVLPAYLLLRRDLGIAGAAAGALLLAVSPLHVHLTRVGSNNAWVGLCTVSALAALYAALRTGLPGAAVHAGTFLGVCFYFGNKAIGLPPTLAAALGVTAAAGAAPLRRQWRLGVLLLGAALLVFLPEAVHYLRTGWYGPLLSHPMRKLVDLGAPGGPGPPAVLAAQLGKALLTFLFLPDRSPFMPRGGFPIVAAGEAALGLVGLALCLGRPRRPLAGFLLGWLLVGIAINVLDRNPPQANHQIGVAALPSLLAAVAICALGAALARALRRPALVPAAVASLAALVASQSAYSYFVAGANRWLIAETTEVGRAMNELAPTHQLVLVTPPMSWDLNSTFKFLARGVRVKDKLVDIDPRARWFTPSGRDVAFIIDARSAKLLPLIRARYPRGELQERRGFAGELRAAVYLVPGAEAERAEAGLSAPAVRPGSR